MRRITSGYNKMAESSGAGLNILVVEDDRSIRNILNDMLRLENHRVTKSPDGESALELLKTKNFDVMITDLGLPGMTGLDLAQAARRLQNNISIISISSWQGKETKNKAQECGIDVTIWKPFKFNQILKAVQALTSPRTDRSIQNQP